MRMSLRWAAVLLAGALALSAHTVALAQRGNGRSGFGGGFGRRGAAVLPQAWVDHLNLSADQQTKLKAAADTYRSAAVSARGLSGQERRQASQQARSSYETAVNGILTADQQKQVQTYRDEAQQYRELGPVANQLVVLNLSDDQKSKIKTIITNHQPDFEKLRSAGQNGGDRSALRSQRQELSAKLRDEVLAVLNADQKSKLELALPARRAVNGGV
jgi:Spy/CpxP family protein refolding chaperone